MSAIQQLIEIIICIISFILGSEGYIYVNPVMRSFMILKAFDFIC